MIRSRFPKVHGGRLTPRQALLPVLVILSLGWGHAGAWGHADATQDVQIVGSYAIDHEVVRTGDQAVVTITLQLTNQGTQPASGAIVALTSSDPAPNGEDPGPEQWLGTFDRADLREGATVRLRTRFVIPLDEFQRWTEQEGPPFWLSYLDESSEQVGVRLRLLRTGSIPDVPGQF